MIADEQVDEGRLAGAVRAEDRGVLSGSNGERQAIEHAHAVLDHARVGQLQDEVVGGRGRVHQGRVRVAPAASAPMICGEEHVKNEIIEVRMLPS